MIKTFKHFEPNSPRLGSETESCSSGALNLSNISEEYKTVNRNSKMEEEKVGPPIEILGPHKFYTDEFDAFNKYYDKIQTLSNEHSCQHLLHLVDQLPLVEYCELSEHVQKLPRKDKQNEMPPGLPRVNRQLAYAHPCLKLLETKDKGRHLITTSKLEKGEVIISEKVTILQVNPICICVEADYKMYRCHHCAYAVTKFYTCVNCNIVIYCSVECLIKSHNEYHRFECEALQRHYWKLDETDHSYMAFRMLMYGALHNFKCEIPENDNNKWGNTDNNYPYICKLQTNFDQLPVKKVYKILKEACRTLIYLILRTRFFKEFKCDSHTDFVKYLGGLYVKHYCQSQMNSVLMRYPNFDEEFAFNVTGCIGKALCPTIAMLNHACSPNAVLIPFNDKVIVRTVKPLQPNTEITIAYQEVYSFLEVEERQRIMLDYFYFKNCCQCLLCTYELTWEEYPYKCNRCQKGRAIKIMFDNGKEKLICKDCKSRFQVDVKAEKTAEIAGNLYLATYSIEPIIRVVDSYERLFPWDSWMFMDAYRMLYCKYEGWKVKPIETMKYGILYFNILEQYLPRMYPACLEARLKFYFSVITTNAFAKLEYVTASEYDIVESFMEDCLKTQKEIKYFVPVRYLEFFFIGLLSKLETVQTNLKVISQLYKIQD